MKKKYSSSKFYKVGLITLEVKDWPDEDICPDDKFTIPIINKDSFEDSEIPDEGDWAINHTDS